MKNFIKVWLCVTVLPGFLYCSNQLLQQQSDTIRAVLVGAHNKAFGKNNIFKQPFTAKEEADWVRALSAVGSFVRANGDAEQNDIWLNCVRGNTQLLRFIEMTVYGLQLSRLGLSMHFYYALRSIKNESDLADCNEIEALIEFGDLDVKSVFSTIMVTLEAGIRQQKQQTYYLQTRKLTRIILEHVAVMLLTTMDKAIRDGWLAALDR